MGFPPNALSGYEPEGRVLIRLGEVKGLIPCRGGGGDPGPQLLKYHVDQVCEQLRPRAEQVLPGGGGGGTRPGFGYPLQN